MNTLIAENVGGFPELLKHLEEMGITRLDGPLSEASRKIPISKGIMKAMVPLFAVVSGVNCFVDAERSKEFQEACGALIRDAAQVDVKLRISLAKVVKAWNTGNQVSKDLHREILALRDEFAAALTVLQAGRLQAITAINGMEPNLAVSKINAAAHQMEKLFISPLDQALGGKRLPMTLFECIGGFLGELSPQSGFHEAISSCGWIVEAIRKARDTYPALDSLLPPQYEIDAEIRKTSNSIEGQI